MTSHCPSISQYTWNGLPQPGSMVYTPEVVQPPAYTSWQLWGRWLRHCSPVKWRTVHGSRYLPLPKMSTCALTGMPTTACHCGKCYHQNKMIWEEHDDSTVHSVSRSDHKLGSAQCLALASADFYRLDWPLVWADFIVDRELQVDLIFFSACGWWLIRMTTLWIISHDIIYNLLYTYNGYIQYMYNV